MSTPVVSNAVPVAPTSSKPPRNPWERVAVWGIIGLLLVVVLIEFRAARGHSATINALNDFAANEKSETTLAEAMQLLAMAPAINGPVAFGQYDHYHCSWLSVFKPGQYKVTLVASREEKPELLLFITPQSPGEPEIRDPQTESVAEGTSNSLRREFGNGPVRQDANGGGGVGGPPVGGAFGRTRRPPSEGMEISSPEPATPSLGPAVETTAVQTETLPAPADPATTPPAEGTP